MTHLTDDTGREIGAEEARRPAERRPYEPPRFESGEAFERVQLASGCNEGIFDGCDVPC
jgi:hypothetical protein